MEVVLVVAVAENGVIGRDGDLPWRLSEDLKHFKAITMGHSIIMGRKTWESIGRPLPGRRNIVITRQPDFEATGADIVSSVPDAILLCETRGAEKAMIIGGGQIYQDMMAEADVIELTEVHKKVDGDTFFPEVDKAVWSETSRRGPFIDDGTSYSFVTLCRQK